VCVCVCVCVCVYISSYFSARATTTKHYVLMSVLLKEKHTAVLYERIFARCRKNLMAPTIRQIRIQFMSWFADDAPSVFHQWLKHLFSSGAVVPPSPQLSSAQMAMFVVWPANKQGEATRQFDCPDLSNPQQFFSDESMRSIVNWIVKMNPSVHGGRYGFAQMIHRSIDELNAHPIGRTVELVQLLMNYAVLKSRDSKGKKNASYVSAQHPSQHHPMPWSPTPEPDAVPFSIFSKPLF
jgi:hypothetical protein